jgi:antitoxin component of RelBE/YafQ-DinJ toxin-antitoxin module
MASPAVTALVLDHPLQSESRQIAKSIVVPPSPAIRQLVKKLIVPRYILPNGRGEGTSDRKVDEETGH